MKTCARCKAEKPSDTYHFSQIKKKSGTVLHSWCKPCCAEDRRLKRKANPDGEREYAARYYAANSERMKARNRDRWSCYAEQNASKIRERHAANRHRYNEARRLKAAASIEVRAAKSEANRKWREAKAAEISERRKLAWANATPTQRLRSYFGAAISHALKGASKGGRSWQAIVGYKADDLKRHLERQFTKGMTWENYGEWHVDHIIPASSFKYEGPDDDEFKACWALTNLRPLWAKDNIRKRDARVHLI